MDWGVGLNKSQIASTSLGQEEQYRKRKRFAFEIGLKSFSYWIYAFVDFVLFVDFVILVLMGYVMILHVFLCAFNILKIGGYMKMYNVCF